VTDFPNRNLDALHKAAKGEAIHAPDGKGLEQHLDMATAALEGYNNGSLSMSWNPEDHEWYVHVFSGEDDGDAALDGQAVESTLDMALYNALGEAGLLP
jgi:hypothetical protein